MKTKLLFHLFLLFSLSICAKKQHEPLPVHGVLWRITGNGLKTPSYLFGTYHALGGMQILDSIKGFDTIFNSTDQLVCESKLDFTIISKPEKKSNSDKLNSFLKPWPVADSTYENLLTNRQKRILDSVLNSDKFLTHMKQVNYRPLMLISYIRFSYSDVHKKPAIKVSKDYKPTNDSIKPFILDIYLQNQAKRRIMNIVALESTDENQRLKDSTYSQIPQMSYRTEVDYSMFYIENHTAIDSLNNENVKNLLSSYLKQDISLCLNLSKQQAKDSYLKNNQTLFYLGYEKFSERSDDLIIDGRNNNWMKKIPDLITEKSSFIAVGCAHLVGETGLINQLRELGYTVDPIQENIKQK